MLHPRKHAPAGICCQPHKGARRKAQHYRRRRLSLLLEALEPRMCLSGIDLIPPPGSPFGAGDGALSVAVGDVDGDGHADLVTANVFDDNVSVLTGDGTGSFGGPSNFGAGDAPFSVAIADVDNNGTGDLITANNFSSDISVLLGDGTGNFGPATSFGVGGVPEAAAVGDFDNNGSVDVVTANSSALSVLLGDGTGSFGPATSIAIGNARSVAVGDFDNDGSLDLAAPDIGNDVVNVLLGDGLGGFSAATTFAVGAAPTGVSISDLNNDGNADLVTLNRFSDEVSVLLGDGLGGFGPLGGAPHDSPPLRFDTGVSPRAAVAGDFDGDGNPDLAVVNRFGDTLSLLLGNGTGNFAPAVNIPVGEEPFSVAIGDFDNDGRADLATANLSSDDVTVLVHTTVSIDDVQVTAGDVGITQAIVTVSMNAEHDVPVTVDYATANGTAIAEVDYESTAGSLTFQPGQTSRWIVVPIRGDAAEEIDEDFFVNLANPSRGTIVDNQAVVTITDNDPVPSLSIGDVTANEGDPGITEFVFTVNLSNPSSQGVTVDFATADGTGSSAATTPSDYRQKSTTVTFAPGELTQQIVVLVNGNTQTEADETFFATLNNPSNATIGDGQGIGTIINDDATAGGGSGGGPGGAGGPGGPGAGGNAAGGGGGFAAATQPAGSAPSTNPTNRWDVDGSGIVTPHDALLLINGLNAAMLNSLGEGESQRTTLHTDVNGDGRFSPADPLGVINYLNRGTLGAAEGEAAAESRPVLPAPTVRAAAAAQVAGAATAPDESSSTEADGLQLDAQPSKDVSQSRHLGSGGENHQIPGPGNGSPAGNNADGALTLAELDENLLESLAVDLLLTRGE